MSAIAAVCAVSTWPLRAVPVIVGAPVGASLTFSIAAVGSEVRVSTIPSPSV
ncbi:hypothetical protein D3C78_614530 [compost metagenome]